MSILIFIAILLVLVVSHEFGHFIVAKKSGIRVDEFSFGFPPKLFGKKIGETTFNFNALPLGGYVKIFGENGDEPDINEADKKRSFTSKPKYIQALVLVAGVAMNFIVAWFLLAAGYMSGLPSSVSSAPEGSIVTNQNLIITSIVKDSPADISGLKAGDKIISLKNDKDILDNPSPESLRAFVKNYGTKEIDVQFIRGKENMATSVTPSYGTDGSPIIGIAMDTIGILKLPVHKAVWEGLKLTSNLTVATTVGFYNLISQAIVGKANLSSITGPVGIVGVVGDAAKFGFIYLLSFTALISVNLAVINLMPFPALDGGRLLFLLIEKIKGSEIKPRIANIINVIGFGLLMILMIVITYKDIVRLI